MNRTITLWILGFVIASGALLLALVVVRADGAPLLAVLPRERALAAYATLLVLFPLFTLSWVLQRAPQGGGRRAATVLAGDSLLFAAVPMVFCAYISAVSAQGLACVAALVAASAAAPLVVARWVPGALQRWCTALAALVLILPAMALFARASRADGLHAVLLPLSPLDWINRICMQRAVPALLPFAAFAAALWALALVPRRHAATAVAAALCLGALPLQDGAVKIESLVAGVARSGARTPVVITVPRGSEICTISNGVTAVDIPADGLAHVALLNVDQQDSLRAHIGSKVQSVAAPWKTTPPGESNAVRLGVGGTGLPQLEQRALELGPGACEAFDVVVVSESVWNSLASAQRTALRDAASLGALILVDQASSQGSVRVGLGRLNHLNHTATAADYARWRRPGVGAADREFLDTFMPMQWQELDLSSVFWFVLCYHLAFLLAFLLPMTLDAHKTPTVYLVSVSFVVLIIAVGGYKVLKQIFLRDNQVYTQSMGLLVSTDAGDELRLRRFIAYASMSSEQRVVEFPRDAQVSVLRAAHALHEPHQLIAGEHARWEFSLDRMQDKVLARVDAAVAPPFALAAQPDGSIALQRESAGAFAGARVRGALLLDGGTVVQSYTAAGMRLVPGSTVPFFLPGVEAAFRKLQGRYGVPMPRHLLVAIEGVERGDIPADWLVQRDLGCFWMVPWP